MSEQTSNDHIEDVSPGDVVLLDRGDGAERSYRVVHKTPSETGQLITLETDDGETFDVDMAAGTVVVRTLDAGSDKPIAFATHEGEENPALGRRAIRLMDLADLDTLPHKIDRLLAHHTPLRRGLGLPEYDGAELLRAMTHEPAETYAVVEPDTGHVLGTLRTRTVNRAYRVGARS